jgi:F420-non-reducing hydrogenase small subunit
MVARQSATSRPSAAQVKTPNPTLAACHPFCRRRSAMTEALSESETQALVCDQCSRTRHPQILKRLTRSRRKPLDPTLCLLEQGVVCCGIATRAGCGALCLQVHSPCIGCYGSDAGPEDFPTRMHSALAARIDGKEPRKIDRIIAEGLGDPAGTFRRYGLAHALMRRRAQRALAAVR